MVSKYDLLYSVFLNDGLAASELLKKLGKTPYEYDAFYKRLKQLAKEGFLNVEEKKYFLQKTEKSMKLIRVLDFCVRNAIDCNELFLDKTVEFIKIGLKKKHVSGEHFNSKTIARISSFLSKHGFLLLDSRKPFSGTLIYSDFLKNVVELSKGEAQINRKNIFEGVDEENLNIKIDSEFAKFRKSPKHISIDDEIQFIHRSLSLEGNTMTLSETAKLIKQNIPPKNRTFQEMQETTDYKKALDMLIKVKNHLDLQKILEFHAKAMNWIEAGAGELRIQNVAIKGNPEFKTADWKDLPRRLEDLFEYYRQNIQKKMKPHEIVDFAAYLHSEFQRIHPFIDGNSRTSRAIFAHTLMLKGFPLITFPAGFVQQYMELTKLSKSRNDRHFTIFMKQLVLHSLKNTNRKMKYA
ncbi:MAG TPA: Fic family protein [archaeon]|nr:Fic family protein [archaeon]